MHTITGRTPVKTHTKIYQESKKNAFAELIMTLESIKEDFLTSVAYWGSEYENITLSSGVLIWLSVIFC